MPSARDVARVIEHTLLRPDATPADVERLCEEASRWGFHAVCVSPVHVRRAARRLEGCGVAVVTVVGFPSGACTTLVKVVEAVEAVSAGAREVDMVGPIGSLKGGDDEGYARDVESVVRAVGPEVAVKVILETGYLNDEEKVRGARLAERAGARFVKTSTGFGPGGATVHDVALLRSAVGEGVGVKASGGIRTPEAVLAMLAAGASRIGTSSGVAIMEQLAGDRS